MKKFFIPLILLSSLTGCIEKKVSFNGQAQGTYYFISYFDKQGRNFQTEIDSILYAYNKSVSTYDTASIISRFNKKNSIPLHDEIFLDNLRKSLRVSEKTHGAFDPTVAPLVNAWGFGFKHNKNPDSAHIDSLSEFVGYDLISIKNNRAVKKDSRVELNFNAIAQGYSVNLIAEFLESKNIDSYLVDIGGEVKTSGKKRGGKKWTVGIEKPAESKHAEREVQVILEIEDKCVATSGNYRKFYVKNGVKYSHTINPKTGKPVNHNLLSASVIADDCALADAYATAFMVMGRKDAMKFVNSRPGKKLEIFLIYSDKKGKYKTVATKGFKKYIREETKKEDNQ